MAINVFTASGNIGKDCEVRFTKNGKGIATFSLPVKSGYGEHEKISWVTCKMFGAKAEGQLPQCLKKGTKVTVTGAFVLEEWEGHNGEQNKMPVILVNDVDFGGRQDGVNNATPPPAQEQQFQTPQAENKDDIPF